jgi:hypothetical protein
MLEDRDVRGRELTHGDAVRSHRRREQGRRIHGDEGKDVLRVVIEQWR